MACPRSEIKQVYLTWKNIFTRNPYLRKKKAILPVVNRIRAYVEISDRLIDILQSLLNDGIFRSELAPADAFPELFPPLNPFRTLL
ncbi:hypothetical protein BX600DRAFT_469982 [Xylariales sp. PMI_506]|nr:hypothetical protein BX600DRAFT_469982 [Xylariales sp. PMI_506]